MLIPLMGGQAYWRIRKQLMLGQTEVKWNVKIQLLSLLSHIFLTLFILTVSALDEENVMQRYK